MAFGLLELGPRRLQVALGRPALEPIGLNALLERIAGDASRRTGRRINVILPAYCPTILGERSFLEQVVENLISNARKYSLDESEVEIEAIDLEEEVKVTARDRGVGVPAEELDKIFDSFHRSEHTSRLASGNGLGLTVCRRLVESMCGRIWAEQRDGGGLVVNFTLRVESSSVQLADDKQGSTAAH